MLFLVRKSAPRMGNAVLVMKNSWTNLRPANVILMDLDQKVLVNVGLSTNPQKVWQHMRLFSSLLQFPSGAKVPPLLLTEVTMVESTIYIFPVVKFTEDQIGAVPMPCSFNGVDFLLASFKPSNSFPGMSTILIFILIP